jgi:uncharacterized protein (TIGR02284 family)
MLLDDRQVALNDVIVVCKDTADHYQDIACRIENTRLSALFQALSRQRRRAAEVLEDRVRQLGYLPREPDTDRETLESLVTHFKALLAENKCLTLLETCEQAEREVAARVSTALQQDLPDHTLADLRRLHAAVIDAQNRLAAEKAKLS